MFYKKLKLFVTNYFKADLAWVIHRSGESQLVSILTETSKFRLVLLFFFFGQILRGNYQLFRFIPLANLRVYCFSYPYLPRDAGFEVSPIFVLRCGIIEQIYLHSALKVVTRFPNWVKI